MHAYVLELGGSLTPRLHRDIAELCREHWGPHAGWAQHVVFAAQRAKLLKNVKSCGLMLWGRAVCMPGREVLTFWGLKQ